MFFLSLLNHLAWDLWHPYVNKRKILEILHKSRPTKIGVNIIDVVFNHWSTYHSDFLSQMIICLTQNPNRIQLRITLIRSSIESKDLKPRLNWLSLLNIWFLQYPKPITDLICAVIWHIYLNFSIVPYVILKRII